VSVGSEGQTLAQTIEAVVVPVVRAHGVTLVDVDVRPGGRRTALRFFIDKPGGVTVGDCQRFSEEVGDLLDVANLVAQSYDLEVSSPGLDRELRKDRELRWAVGKRIRAWTREPLAGQYEFVGQLVEVGETSLSLAEAVGLRQLPRAAVTKVRLDVELHRSA
jgi:ribosome maturation factor RimP